VRRDAGNQLRESALLRAVSTFCVTAGIVLAGIVAAFLVRDWLLPPTNTWSVWTGGALIVVTLIAIGLWVVGALLARRVHQARRDTVRTFLTPDERARVVDAIRTAEAGTSGEICVHLCERASDRPSTAAAAVMFDRLGLANTRERNGVLFFVSIRDHQLAVIGDRGIHQAVPAEFWASVVTRVESAFAEGRFGDGLSEGVLMAGARLAEHFPRRADDVNELSDGLTDSRDD